ncbi:MAG: crossover junction endodeoxyribonuclease RuvC [Alphaproteobacteria bacterium]|nr:crossover junction endodeoxyribonuclease RuvC [Alphaproteobacteria bacterium]
MRILGIDPGLQKTGWGIIESVDNRLSFVQCGLIKTQAALPLYARLAEIDAGLTQVLAQFAPDEAAIEITFVNENPASALKLGMARGAAMTCPARHGLSVAEYAPNLIKKSLVGTGHASKDQVGMMIKMLLPTSGKMGADEADALAIAICHAHHATTNSRIRDTTR